MRRIDFFFWMRRSSLFETNQRLRRTVLRMPLLATFLRKRLSSWSCDSFGRRLTVANVLTSLPFQNTHRKDKKTRLTFMLQPSQGMVSMPIWVHASSFQFTVLGCKSDFLNVGLNFNRILRICQRRLLKNQESLPPNGD
jgi:hypothetical protein